MLLALSALALIRQRADWRAKLAEVEAGEVAPLRQREAENGEHWCGCKGELSELCRELREAVGRNHFIAPSRSELSLCFDIGRMAQCASLIAPYAREFGARNFAGYALIAFCAPETSNLYGRALNALDINTDSITAGGSLPEPLKLTRSP